MKTKSVLITVFVLICTISFSELQAQERIIALSNNCKDNEIIHKSFTLEKNKKSNTLEKAHTHLQSTDQQLLERFLNAFEEDKANAYEVHEIRKKNFFSKTYTFYDGEDGPYKVKKSKRKTVKILDKKQPHTECSIVKYDDGRFIVNTREYHK